MVSRNRPRMGCSEVEGWWEYDLPFSRPLSLNDTGPWRVKARRIRECVDATILLTRASHIRGKVKRISVQLTYTPRDNRRRDPLNLVATLKAVEDGIVRAGGVVPDDNPRYVTSVMPRITAGSGEVGRITVRIIRLE